MEVNAGLDGTPEDVHSDPYGKGWMVKSSITEQSEVADLLDAAAYKTLVGA